MGKVLLVTGVSRGIGRSIVEYLGAQADANVVGIARSQVMLDEISEQFVTFHGIAGDITCEDVLEKAVRFVEEQFGHLDAVICNAGLLDPVQRVEHAEIEHWRACFEVNYFSNVLLLKRTLPLLRESCGNIILVSSGASVKGYRAWGAYGGSKAALNHLAATVAAEESNVKIVSVAPGVVDTQMQHDIRERYDGLMEEDDLKRFRELKDNNEILNPELPAKLFSRLSLEGIPDELNGKYLRYNDEQLKPFNDER